MLVAAEMVSRDLVKDWPVAPTPQPPPPHTHIQVMTDITLSMGTGCHILYPQHQPMPHAMPMITMTYPQPPSVVEKAEEYGEYAASVPNSVNEENK